MKQKFTDNYGDTVEVYDFDETVYLETMMNPNSDNEKTTMLELSQSVAIHLAEAILKAARKASKAA